MGLPVVPPVSGSVSVAVTLTPTCGCRVDNVTVPGSSTLVTSISTSSVALLVPSEALTVNW